jgi:hypothetical protein
MFRLSAATEDKYLQLELDPSIQVVANYNPKTILDSRGSKTNPLHPYGTSGGGIWTLQTKESKTVGLHDPKLVGIATEWKAADNVMVGVRVNVMVALIARAFPETRKFFSPEGTLFPELERVDPI